MVRQHRTEDDWHRFDRQLRAQCQHARQLQPGEGRDEIEIPVRAHVGLPRGAMVALAPPAARRGPPAAESASTDVGATSVQAAEGLRIEGVDGNHLVARRLSLLQQLVFAGADHAGVAAEFVQQVAGARSSRPAARRRAAWSRRESPAPPCPAPPPARPGRPRPAAVRTRLRSGAGAPRGPPGYPAPRAPSLSEGGRKRAQWENQRAGIQAAGAWADCRGCPAGPPGCGTGTVRRSSTPG